MKIRDKLIKLFGGYTQEEYDIFAKRKIPIIKKTVPTVTLKTYFAIDDKLNNTEDFIDYVKESLAKEIGKQMLKNDLIAFDSEPIAYGSNLKAVAKIVDINQNGKDMFELHEQKR